MVYSKSFLFSFYGDCMSSCSGTQDKGAAQSGLFLWLRERKSEPVETHNDSYIFCLKVTHVWFSNIPLAKAHHMAKSKVCAGVEMSNLLPGRGEVNNCKYDLMVLCLSLSNSMKSSMSCSPFIWELSFDDLYIPHICLIYWDIEIFKDFKVL